MDDDALSPSPAKTAKLADGVDVVTEYDLRFGKLACSVGSVVNFTGDAIVNAANSGCLGGGGVDGAICRAGGEDLARAREALPLLSTCIRCNVGDAVLTVGGDLKATWCVHAVGPNYADFDDDEQDPDDLLRGAYAAAMQRAKEKHVSTLAFALLSAGIFRGNRTLSQVLRIAVDSISRNTYEGLAKVHLVAFTDTERLALLRAADYVLRPSTDESTLDVVTENTPAPHDSPPRLFVEEDGEPVHEPHERGARHVVETQPVAETQPVVEPAALESCASSNTIAPEDSVLDDTPSTQLPALDDILPPPPSSPPAWPSPQSGSCC